MALENRNPLERWVLSLVDRPLQELIRRYGAPERRLEEDGEAYEHPNRAAERELEDLYASGVSDVDSGRVAGAASAEALRRLHAKLRGTPAEQRVWAAVIGELTHPLPDDVADDLIDREVAIDQLGHSRQSDLVQWRLAEFYDEALLTLGKELYARHERGLEEFQSVLDTGRTGRANYPWLLESLADLRASSPEKEQAYLRALEDHPDREWALRTRRVRALENQAHDETVTPEQAEALHATGEPEVWLALAGNPATPTHILEQLAGVAGVKRAKQIRTLARERLGHRRGSAGHSKPE